MSEDANSRLLPSGKEILARMKAAGQELPKEQEEGILAISDDEAMAAFLASNIGDTIDPDEMRANSIFSGWLMDKLNVGAMVLTIQYDNLAQAGRAIAFCNEELEKPGMTPEQRNSALRVLVEAIRQRGTLAKTALHMAGMIKPPAAKPAPKNQGPDTLQQVVVQVNQAQPPQPAAKPFVDSGNGRE